MYEMKYLKERDMPYFRRLAEEGAAIIIELPDQAFFEIGHDAFRAPDGKVDRKDLEEALRKQEGALQEISKEGQRLSMEVAEMERLLREPEDLPDDLNSMGRGTALLDSLNGMGKEPGFPDSLNGMEGGQALSEGQVRAVIEDLVRDFMQGVHYSSERRET